MKISDLLEGDIVYPNFKRKEKSPNDNVDYDVMFDLQKSMLDSDSPKKLSNELDRKRYEKMLVSRKGEYVPNSEVVPYVRQMLNPNNKEIKTDFNKFLRVLFSEDKHLYEIVTYLNNLLSKFKAPRRVTGVSQDSEDWYFSKV